MIVLKVAATGEFEATKDSFGSLRRKTSKKGALQWELS
jgi:hypothetical protein